MCESEKEADPEFLMSAEERKQLAELDDTVTIYCGITGRNKTVGHALSWTLNRKTAEWFAHRFKSAGLVCLFGGRGCGS